MSASTSWRPVLDYYERSDKYNNICISGLKEDDESKDSVPLQQQVVTLASKIGVTLENTDVDRVFRTGKPDPDRARPVIVKLSNNYTKRQLLTNSQVLRKKQGYAGVYLNDDLTFANRKIAALARTRIREGKLQKTWSINGSIFVSDNLNRKVRINSEADIEIAIVKAMKRHQERRQTTSAVPEEARWLEVVSITARLLSPTQKVVPSMPRHRSRTPPLHLTFMRTPLYSLRAILTQVRTIRVVIS